MIVVILLLSVARSCVGASHGHCTLHRAGYFHERGMCQVQVVATEPRSFPNHAAMSTQHFILILLFVLTFQTNMCIRRDNSRKQLTGIQLDLQATLPHDTAQLNMSLNIICY